MMLPWLLSYLMETNMYVYHVGIKLLLAYIIIIKVITIHKALLLLSTTSLYNTQESYLFPTREIERSMSIHTCTYIHICLTTYS